MKSIATKDKNEKAYKNLKKTLQKLRKEELKKYAAFKSHSKKFKKIFPDISKIFLCPTKGGVYMSPSTAERLMSYPPIGVIIAYYLLKHPRIAKKIYNISPFEEEELTKIMFSKECIKLGSKYYSHSSK